MSVVAEVEEQALSLTPKERGELITKLLRSLPEPSSDEDNSVTVALNRREQLRQDPDIAISLEELDRRMRERFR